MSATVWLRMSRLRMHWPVGRPDPRGGGAPSMESWRAAKADGATAAVTPDALPGYETMTIAQLRGRLRSLSLDQVTETTRATTGCGGCAPAVRQLLAQRPSLGTTLEGTRS